MKKILLISLLALAPLTYAEKFDSKKPVICDNLQTIVNFLQEDESIKEHIVWTGTDIKGRTQYIMFANDHNKTWTLIEHNGEVACVLGAGVDGAPKFGVSI